MNARHFTEGVFVTGSILDEVNSVELGDERLNHRLKVLLESFSQKPNMSIPAACGERKKTEAAYRFFDNPKVKLESILPCHYKNSIERIKDLKVVLLVQDTTELDITRPHDQVEDMGPVDGGARFGFFFHPLMAFDTSGVPHGMVWTKCWTRTQPIEGEVKDKNRRKKLPIEEKESIRWIEGVREARNVAEQCRDTQCICIGDSESDIFEVFAEPLSTTNGQLHLIVRGAYDRALADGTANVLETVRRTPVLYEQSIEIRKRESLTSSPKSPRKKSRDARTAVVNVHATSVTINPGSGFEPVTLNAVLVEEPNPDNVDAPIQWLLLTTLPIDTIEDVQRIVQYYCQRWGIEVYFKTLKSGCRIEERYFQKYDRLRNSLAIYSIVAWRILYMCRLGRECPDVDCEVVFEPCEWKSVYMTVKNTIPKEVPKLNEMIRLVASLGGYIIRAKTNPGIQTLWFGMQRVQDLALAWNKFGPETTRPKIF